MPYADKNDNVCGFMDIEEKENSNQFHRKFFLLDRRKNVLECYMDNPLNLPDGSQPVNQFNLHFMSIVGDAKRLKPKEQFCLYFTFAGKNIFLKANDAHDKEAWIEQLKESAKVTVVTTTSPTSATSGALPAGAATATHSHNSVHCSTDENSTSYKVEVYGDNMVIRTRNSTSNDDLATDPDSAPKTPNSVDLWNPYSLQDQEIKTGYGTKQGQIRKSWKRRYFILTPITLSYYKEQLEKEAIKSIALADVVEARISVGIHLNREHVFEVVTGQRVYYVQTETAGERDAWIVEINQCIDRLRKPRPRRLEAHSQTDETLWSLSRSVSSLANHSDRYTPRAATSSGHGHNHNHNCQCSLCEGHLYAPQSNDDSSTEVTKQAAFTVWV